MPIYSLDPVSTGRYNAVMRSVYMVTLLKGKNEMTTEQTQWKLDSMTPAHAKDHYQNCQGCSDRSGVNTDGVCWACAQQFRIGYRNPTTGQIDGKGIITSPGKFEGCPRYVPYFWDAYLNGMADRDDGSILGFDISADDKAIFPELKRRKTVKLVEDSQGFVSEV